LAYPECDEFQHKDRISSCEWARMTQLKAAAVVSGELRPLVFYRWNPDAFKVDGVTTRVSIEERSEALRWMLENYVPEHDMEVIFMFCDCETNAEGDVFPCVVRDPAFPEALRMCVGCVSK
jgi:hypothetical protein